MAKLGYRRTGAVAMVAPAKNVAVVRAGRANPFPQGTMNAQMLERRDYRVIAGVRAADVWPKVWEWWKSAGFAAYPIGPNHLVAASYYARIGLRREVEVRLQEANESLYVDVAFRARLTEEGAVGGVVAAVVFWPIAAVGGALSWAEYENDANALLASFWGFLWQLTGRPSQILYVTAPPFGTPVTTTPPPPPSAPSARPCPRCGVACLPEWRACPYCGAPLIGARG